MKDLPAATEELSEERCMEPTTRHSLVLRLRNRDDEAAWAEFLGIYEPLSVGAPSRPRFIRE